MPSPAQEEVNTDHCSANVRPRRDEARAARKVSQGVGRAELFPRLPAGPPPGTHRPRAVCTGNAHEGSVPRLWSLAGGHSGDSPVQGRLCQERGARASLHDQSWTWQHLQVTTSGASHPDPERKFNRDKVTSDAYSDRFLVLG